MGAFKLEESKGQSVVESGTSVTSLEREYIADMNDSTAEGTTVHASLQPEESKIQIEA